MNITLFGRPYNRTDRVQWTLEELSLPYEYRVLDVFGLEHRAAEFRERYGLARLPFVEIDGEIMFESGAIMLYLAERFRDRKELLPVNTDPDYRAVLQWLFFGVSTLEASDPNRAPDDAPAPSASLAATLSFLNQHLARRKYIASDRFTIADIALANGLKWFGPAALNDFPNVERYFRLQTARPAFQKMTEQPEYPRR